MAYNDRKIVEVLLRGLDGVPERCPGYRDVISELVVEVLTLEREHAISKTNIVQKIGDRVNAAGILLYKKRTSSAAQQEGDQ